MKIYAPDMTTLVSSAIVLFLGVLAVRLAKFSRTSVRLRDWTVAILAGLFALTSAVGAAMTVLDLLGLVR